MDRKEMELEVGQISSVNVEMDRVRSRRVQFIVYHFT